MCSECVSIQYAMINLACKNRCSDDRAGRNVAGASPHACASASVHSLESSLKSSGIKSTHNAMLLLPTHEGSTVRPPSLVVSVGALPRGHRREGGDPGSSSLGNDPSSALGLTQPDAAKGVGARTVQCFPEYPQYHSTPVSPVQRRPPDHPRRSLELESREPLHDVLHVPF